MTSRHHRRSAGRPDNRAEPVRIHGGLGRFQAARTEARGIGSGKIIPRRPGHDQTSRRGRTRRCCPLANREEISQIASDRPTWISRAPPAATPPAPFQSPPLGRQEDEGRRACWPSAAARLAQSVAMGIVATREIMHGIVLALSTDDARCETSGHRRWIGTTGDFAGFSGQLVDSRVRRWHQRAQPGAGGAIPADLSGGAESIILDAREAGLESV